MKNFILGFVIGGALSGVSTYFVTKTICEKKAQLHIENMRKEYKEKYSPKNSSIQKEDPSTIVEKYDELTKIYSERGDLVKEDPAEKESPSDDAPDEYYDDDDIDQARENASAKEAYDYDKLHRTKGQRLISQDDYGQAPGFESKEVSYYVDDDTYVYDDSDEIIDDPTFVFGSTIRNIKWDQDDSQTDDICIRNFNLGTDYKVNKNFCAYEMQ